MKRTSVSGLVVVAAVSVAAEARGQDTEPLYAQMGWCEPVADCDPNTGACGASPEHRWVAIRFGYARDASVVDVQDAVAATDTVEVCWERGPWFRCPWSEDEDAEWLVWDRTLKGADDSRRRAGDVVQPSAERVAWPDETSPIQTFHLKYDWEDPNNEGTVLLLRVRRPGWPEAFLAYDDEFRETITRDGLCPAPAAIVEWPAPGGNEPAHFRAHGARADLYAGLAPFYFGVDPCTGGRRSLPDLVWGAGCVDRTIAEFAVEELYNIYGWQVREVHAGSRFSPEETWQYGSGGDCGGDCPTRVFFHPFPAGIVGRLDPDQGAIRYPPHGDWDGALMPTDQLTRRMAHAFATLGHEFWHQNNSAWARARGLPRGPLDEDPYKEGVTGTVGERLCFEGYDKYGELPDQTCISPGRLVRRTHVAAEWLVEPRLGMLRPWGEGAALWAYAIEQFATPLGESPAHPSGERSGRERVPQLALGDAARSPSEGIDLFRHILDAYTAPGQTVLDVVDRGLVHALGRALEPIVFDAATAYVLKDYSDLENMAAPGADTRFYLVWAGNPNVGQPVHQPTGDPYFPDLPPPNLVGLLSRDQAKAANSGRLPVPVGFVGEGDWDYMPRARRVLDSYEDTGAGIQRWTLAPGDFRASSEPVALDAFGAAVLSVHPDPSYGWLGVRVRAESSELPRVRIFLVDSNGVPRAHGGCHFDPDGAGADDTEQCRWQPNVAPDQTAVAEVNAVVATTNPSSPPDVDEVLVVVGAGKRATSFSWSIGNVQPRVVIADPTAAHPADIGHAHGPSGSRPFLLRFNVLDSYNYPVLVDDADIRIFVPGCADPSNGCELEAGGGDVGGYELHEVEPGSYWAVVNVPSSYYPPALTLTDDLDVRVEVAGYGSDVQQRALRVRAFAPRVALELAVSRSWSMATDYKSLGARLVGDILIDALGESDSIGIVGFSDDAETYYELQSLCAGADDVKHDAHHALYHLVSHFNIQEDYCSSIGDGLFEAQAWLALHADPGSGHVEPYPDCVPDEHSIVLISDGIEYHAQYPASEYYLGAGWIDPPRDGSPKCVHPNVEDDELPYGGWLRYHDRRVRGLKTPTVSVVAIGPDALGGELERIIDGTEQRGTLGYAEGALDSSEYSTRAGALALVEAAAQAAGDALGFERVGSWRVPSAFAPDMPEIVVEPMTTELLVTVASPRDDVTGLELHGPAGQLHVPVERRPDSAVFRVESPAPGTYAFALAGSPPPSIPEEPVAVLVEQSVRGAVSLFAQAEVAGRELGADSLGEDDGRLVGSVVRVRAMAIDLGAVRGGGAYAELTRPDGTTRSLELHDDGAHDDAGAADGLFGASFHDTALPGGYTVRLRVAGASALTGAPFARERVLAVPLRMGLDPDHDGMADSLERRYSPSGHLDPTGDDDQDGAPNLVELANWASPLDADSDGGGEADGSELARGADPRDVADDHADVLVPLVAPGNDKVLIAPMAPPDFGASIELQRAPANEGIYVTRYTGSVPADGIVEDDAPNDVLACYRIRSTRQGATSDWSNPECVTPRTDPIAPSVSLRLVSGIVRPGDRALTLGIDAVDRPLDPRLPRYDSAHVSDSSELLSDPDIVPSGLAEMLVSDRADFLGASWQAYEPEVVMPVTAPGFFSLYARVRDHAGNVSEVAHLPVMPVDDWPRQLLAAQTSVTLEVASIASGTVAVAADAEEALAGGAELRLGPGARIAGRAIADTVRLMPGAVVEGDAYFNALTGKGAVTGATVSPLELPLPLHWPDLPSMPSGGDDVTVSHGAELALEPGSYGAVRVEDDKLLGGSLLTLHEGRYEMDELRVGSRCRLECEGHCDVAVASDLVAGSRAYLGGASPQAPPSGLEIVVLGEDPDDGHGGEPRGRGIAASLGAGAVLRGRLWAANGSVSVGSGANVTGKLAGRRILLGPGASAQESDL